MGRPASQEHLGKVRLLFSNPDLLWSNEHPTGRFGQGAFRTALEALHSEVRHFKAWVICVFLSSVMQRGIAVRSEHVSCPGGFKCEFFYFGLYVVSPSFQVLCKASTCGQPCLV